MTGIVTALILSPFLVVFAQNVAERRALLEKELKEVEAQIEEQQNILNARARESVTLERDIAILNATIEKAKLSIRARSLEIERLGKESGEKQVVIKRLSAKIEREKESIGELIRKADKADSFSLPEIILGGKNFSEFFQDIEEYQVIKGALRDSYKELATDKKETEEEQEALDLRQTEEVQLRKLQELEKKKIEAQEAEKKRILKISKGIEAEYQKIIKIKQLSAAQIRAELFTLRGSAAIPFGKALEYATLAGKKTGVRPALILGIIAEESNLGENVGTGNWRVDMKAPRDTEPFLDITRRLGFDPDKMPVSKKPWYGYGGAMGPAQFIPSTWVLYEERIAKATGHNPPNPWEPFDAFLASALLLMDNGADKGTPAAERLAALRYLAGWANAGKKAYAFYGDDVMELAEKYQRQIDILNSS
ncbi:MAG: Peptidase M23 [Parcubacteria group bacterium GW2011_GWA2_47_64]|nr:MAG: Peptidase M23 [Parcubacteria group bacterium GW2011_GWA2_47_64]KKU96986.1 MAG: Peptidase M23 [Parcubacteria group bacterium GW2011_GWC2_48_17]